MHGHTYIKINTPISPVEIKKQSYKDNSRVAQKYD